MERNRFFRRGPDITQERNIQREEANPIDRDMQIGGVPNAMKTRRIPLDTRAEQSQLFL